MSLNNLVRTLQWSCQNVFTVKGYFGKLKMSYLLTYLLFLLIATVNAGNTYKLYIFFYNSLNFWIWFDSTRKQHDQAVSKQNLLLFWFREENILLTVVRYYKLLTFPVRRISWMNLANLNKPDSKKQWRWKKNSLLSNEESSFFKIALN